MAPAKGKHADKGKSGHHGKHGAVTSPVAEPTEAAVVLEPPPVIIEQPVSKEPVITDVDLMLRELEAFQIARPKRVNSRDLMSLLPYYKPKPREPLLVVWTDLDYRTVLRLSEAKNSEEIRQIVAERTALIDNISQPKDQIVLDLYCQVFNQATKMQLNFEQASALFSIVKNVHEKAIETPMDNTKDCLEYMDAMLCRHIVKRPPWSAMIFDVHQAKQLRDYMIRTYFRHFEMYKYVFTPSICMDLKVEYEKAATTKPVVSSYDHHVHDPVKKGDTTLEDVLNEIDLEEQREKAIADGLPAPVPAAAVLPEDHPNKVPATVASEIPPPDPRLTALEAVVSKQMDDQLKILRERITDKLRQVDEVLKKATGITGPIDQFSLSPTEPNEAPHKAGKVTPHKAAPADKTDPKKKPKK